MIWSCFALKATESQLQTVCLGNVAEATAISSKLQLLYHGPNPLTSKGLDFVNKCERAEAMRVISAIRADMLKT